MKSADKCRKQLIAACCFALQTSSYQIGLTMNVILPRTAELLKNDWRQSFGWFWRKTDSKDELHTPGFAGWVENTTIVSKNSISLLPFYRVMSKSDESNHIKLLVIFGNASHETVNPFSKIVHSGTLLTLLDNMAVWQVFYDGNQIIDIDSFISKSQEYKDSITKYRFVTISTQTQHLSDKYKSIETNTFYEIDVNSLKKYTTTKKTKTRHMSILEIIVYRVSMSQNNINCQRTPVMKAKFTFIRVTVSPKLKYSPPLIDSKEKKTDSSEAGVLKYDKMCRDELNQCKLVPISPFMQELTNPKHNILDRYATFIPDLVNSCNYKNNVTSIYGYFVLGKLSCGPKDGAHGGLIYSLLYEIGMQIVDINVNLLLSQKKSDYNYNMKNKYMTSLIQSEIKYKQLVSINKFLKIEAQISQKEEEKFEVQSWIIDPLDNQSKAIATFVFMRTRREPAFSLSFANSENNMTCKL